METFICRIRTHVLMTIIEGLFHSPQTLNVHVKKGTGSLIRLPGVTTVKWSQIGAALTFLSNLPSLVKILKNSEAVLNTHPGHQYNSLDVSIVALILPLLCFFISLPTVVMIRKKNGRREKEYK